MLQTDKRRHATLKQKIEINDLLRKYLVEGEDGYWHYIDGWSDDMIADRVGVPSAKSVSNSRLECFGPVQPAPVMRKPDPRIDDLVKGGQYLQRLILELQHDFDDLRIKHDRLCQQLSVNKITNVTHLLSEKQLTLNVAQRGST